MKKAWVVGGILIILALGFILAEGNETNQTTIQNNTNINQTINNSTIQNNTQSNDSLPCTEENNCPNTRECENGFCAMGKNKKNNETEDNENDSSQDNQQNQNNPNKICCLRTITRGNESYQKYNFIERKDCLTFENKTNKQSQIVANSLCQERKMNKTETQEQRRERQTLKFENKTGVDCPNDCICTGVVMKCVLEDGTREMNVYSQSGNLIIQIKDTNMSTNVTLYKDENGTLYAHVGGKNKQLKFLPDQIKDKIKEALKQSAEIKNITLDENAVYEVQVQKKSRLFFIFPVSEKSDVNIDSESGQVVKLRNPWWGFLAKDNKD
jgi:hypothetical protein